MKQYASSAAVVQEKKYGASVPADVILLSETQPHIQHAVHTFLLTKGIHPFMLDAYTMYSISKSRVIFPTQLSNEGVLLSGVGRSLDANVQPKWVVYGAIIENIILLNNPLTNVILTEDYLSALKVAWVVSKLKLNIAVIPLMGTYLSPKLKLKFFKEAKNILCMLDGDKAGYTGTAKIQKDLGSFFNVKTYTKEGLDPKDMSIDSLIEGVKYGFSCP